jgi:hypothetical protein
MRKQKANRAVAPPSEQRYTIDETAYQHLAFTPRSSEDRRHCEPIIKTPKSISRKIIFRELKTPRWGESKVDRRKTALDLYLINHPHELQGIR